MTKMQIAARSAAVKLLDAAETQKGWTPALKAQWTRAFNACNALAGKKIRK